MTSITLSKTAGDLIRMALVDGKITPVEQPIEAIDFETAIERLQLILKHWQGQGIHLWTKEEAVLPLIKDRRQYRLGPDGDECGEFDTFVNTTSNAAHVSTDTVLTLTSTSGMEGAPDVLEVDPASSTNGWTAQNFAVLTVINDDELEVANGPTFALKGTAKFSLDVDPGSEYQIDFDLTIISAGGVDVRVVESSVVLDSELVTVSGSGSLRFTVSDFTTSVIFSFINQSTDVDDTNVLVSLNYRLRNAGDRIGIEMDDGTRYWDSIVTVDSSTQVTINNGLPSASASGLTVFSFENPIDRPVRILQYRFGENVKQSEIPVHQVSRAEYFDQPDKDSRGTVVWCYYSPQLTLGELYVWQVASSVKQVLRFTYERPIRIPTGQSDTLDIPFEWFMTLKWALAAEIGPSYGLNVQDQATNEGKARTHLEEILPHDVERDSMDIQPDFL